MKELITVKMTKTEHFSGTTVHQVMKFENYEDVMTCVLRFIQEHDDTTISDVFTGGVELSYYEYEVLFDVTFRIEGSE